jgi:hypothetical protein
MYQENVSILVKHIPSDLSENGSRVYCAGEPLSPEQLRKASQRTSQMSSSFVSFKYVLSL